MSSARGFFTQFSNNNSAEVKPLSTFYYFANGELKSVEYASIPELKEIVYNAFSDGKITERGYKQILSRFVKLSNDTEPIQDLKDWLSALYAKGTIKVDVYKLYYNKIEKIRCPQR